MFVNEFCWILIKQELVGRYFAFGFKITVEKCWILFLVFQDTGLKLSLLSEVAWVLKSN